MISGYRLGMAVDGLGARMHCLARKFVNFSKNASGDNLTKTKCLTLTTLRANLRNNPSWQRFFRKFNENVIAIGESICTQCNAVAAQRMRRASQILIMYRKLYGERSLYRVLENFRKSLPLSRGKNPLHFLLGAVFFSWDKEKITDCEMSRYICTTSHIWKHPCPC